MKLPYYPIPLFSKKNPASDSSRPQHIHVIWDGCCGSNLLANHQQYLCSSNTIFNHNKLMNQLQSSCPRTSSLTANGKSGWSSEMGCIPIFKILTDFFLMGFIPHTHIGYNAGCQVAVMSQSWFVYRNN